MNSRQRIVGAALSALLAGCSGASSSLSAVPQTGQAPGASLPGTSLSPQGNAVRFLLKLPASAVPNASPSPSQFPTPAIGSLKVTVTPAAGRSQQPAILNLGPATCVASTTGMAQCSLLMPLAPGAYTATIGLYAGANAVGMPLGTPQSIALSVGATRPPTVAMATGEAPAAVSIATSSFAVRGSQAAGFTFYGTTAQSAILNGIDASGDVLVGPGAPTFTATIGGGGWQVTQPASATPNVVTITPPNNTVAGATLAVTAQYPDGTCQQAGAVCSASVQLANDLQLLMVANCSANCNGKSGGPVPGSVTVYAPPYTAPPTTVILNGIVQPNALLTDAQANLYVSNAFGGPNGTGSITIYAPPYTGTPTTIASGINNPGAFALDAAGDLWVANQAGNGPNGTIAEYAPPFGGKPIRSLSGFTGVPTGIALDTNGNLFVTTGSALYEFASPYTGPPNQLVTGLAVANGITFDGSGNLIYADSNGAVQLFAPPYDAPPTQLPRINGTLGLLAAYPAGGVVFIPDGSGNVAEFAAPYNGPPQVIQTGNPNAKGIAVDAAGDVYVSACGSGCGNNGTDAITVYTPPYTNPPTTITSGVVAPSAVTLTK